MIKEFYNKNKKLCMLILSIIGIVLIIIFGIYFVVMFDMNDADKIIGEYEKLNDESTSDGKKFPTVNISDYEKLEYISSDELINVFNNSGDAVVYFGYPTCLYCRTAIQVLVNIAKDTELDVLYYYDIEEKSNDASKLYDLIGDEFIESVDGKKNIYSPLVIFVADGRIVSYNKGTLFSQKDPYQKLDQSQIDGLSDIYKYGIMDVLESKRNKGVLK